MFTISGNKVVMAALAVGNKVVMAALAVYFYYSKLVLIYNDQNSEESMLRDFFSRCFENWDYKILRFLMLKRIYRNE